MAARLVRHDGVERRARPAQLLEEAIEERLDQAPGLLEDGAPLHREEVHLRRRGRIVGMAQRAAAEDARRVRAAAVRLEARVVDAAGVAGAAPRDDGGGGRVAEEHVAL